MSMNLDLSQVGEELVQYVEKFCRPMVPTNGVSMKIIIGCWIKYFNSQHVMMSEYGEEFDAAMEEAMKEFDY